MDGPALDPENELTLEEIMAVNASVDFSLAAQSTGPVAVQDENGDYVSTHGNPPTFDAPISSQRCEHTAQTTGKRCKRWAVRGLRACRFHSEFDDATMVLRDFVLEYARRDLYRMTPMALDVIEEIMTDTDVSPAVRLKAATETLDRIGVRGGSEVQVNVETTMVNPADEIRARLERLAPKALDAVPGLAESAGYVVDAEIVE
jgi:hypothetical protein